MVKIVIAKKYFMILVILLFVFLVLGVVVSQPSQFAHHPDEIHINIDGSNQSLQTAINLGEFNGLDGADQGGDNCKFCKNGCAGDYSNVGGYIGHKAKAYGGGTCQGTLGDSLYAWLCCK